jgi:ABC-type glycerol-3-phosphate transport system substrate-binding protein
MRPPVPQFEELSELFGTVFHDMISGKIAPDEAIAKAQAGAVKDMAQ